MLLLIDPFKVLNNIFSLAKIVFCKNIVVGFVAGVTSTNPSFTGLNEAFMAHSLRANAINVLNAIKK